MLISKQIRPCVPKEKAATADRESIVVVGNGPVGFRLLQGLVSRQLTASCQVTVFGEETQPAYNRVNLTKLLDDASPYSLQYESRSWYEDNGIALHSGDPVVNVDRERRVVISESGRMVRYDRLVLATGSRPFIPPVPGIDEEGVFAYRTIDDVGRIRDYVAESMRAVVLGGGLLGLEAAHALTKLGVSVYVVEMASVLMPRQLDSESAALLQKMVQSSRVRVLLQKETQRISRTPEGLHVQFTNGESVLADTVVVSTGIRPRDELAVDCGLSVGRRGGIIVDDELRTNDPSIYAIGECAEHDGMIYGLVAPGFRMANTLVDRFCGGESRFRGSNEATRLKLVETNVVFAGDYLDTTRATVLVWATLECYVKLILRYDRLVGLIGVGKVPQLDRIQEAIDQRRRFYWWHTQRFETTGRLWKKNTAVNAAAWPPEAVICNCTGVTRGTLAAARERGCATVKSLATVTQATTVCGSCLPLVRQICGQPAGTTYQGGRNTALTGLSIMALVTIAALLLTNPVILPSSVRTVHTVWQTLITEFFWKQVTGYSLLSLALLSLSMSLRKRTTLLNFVSFQSFRVLHVFLATASLFVLMAHTGFHRGSNLNYALFSVFMITSASGALAGILAGMELRLPLRLRRLRKLAALGHIICLWPLPLLVVFHIVSVYWL